MKELDKIIVSDVSYNSHDPFKLIYSNVTVVNLLREEGIDMARMHEDSITSYYIDYYLDQYNNGNFSQFVWNSQWSKSLNDEIKAGLSKIGAQKHLKLFLAQSEKVEALSQDDLRSFLENGYFEDNPTRDHLDNDAFYDLEEDLVALNASWLRGHRDLKVLSIENMFLALEKFIDRKIER